MAGLEEAIRWPVDKAGAGVTWELCYNAGDLPGFFCSLKQDLFSSLCKVLQKEILPQVSSRISRNTLKTEVLFTLVFWCVGCFFLFFFFFFPKENGFFRTQLSLLRVPHPGFYNVVPPNVVAHHIHQS